MEGGVTLDTLVGYVEHIIYRNADNGYTVLNLVSGEEENLALDGVFVSIGRSPASGLVAGQLVLDGDGYIIADESTRTNLPGVFAAGDVRTTPLRQIVTATADGAVAATAAQEYLA